MNTSSDIVQLSNARRALELAKTVPDLKTLRDKAKAMEHYLKRHEGSEHAFKQALEIRLHAERKIGELLSQTVKRGGNSQGGSSGPIPDSISQSDSARWQSIAAIPRRDFDKALDRMWDDDVEVVPSTASLVRMSKHEQKTADLKSIRSKKAKKKLGVYDAIVIDPPWPMVKVEREVRPNQAAFDYPTMTEEELAALKVPCAGDCHVWVWTTHKFLPMAFRLLETWKLKYVCTFVWHKPGGFQPIGLPQYNCEFALYARRGTPILLDTKALPTCFKAPRGKHSEKPEAFYDVVRRVTGGRRLDMFNRRAIKGFDGWGKEAAE